MLHFQPSFSSSVVERQFHDPEVPGTNPSTGNKILSKKWNFFFISRDKVNCEVWILCLCSKISGLHRKTSGLQRKSFRAAAEKLRGCSGKASGLHGKALGAAWNIPVQSMESLVQWGEWRNCRENYNLKTFCTWKIWQIYIRTYFYISTRPKELSVLNRQKRLFECKPEQQLSNSYATAMQQLCNT